MPESVAVLETLKGELKFLQDGGYGRSPRTPWRPNYIFEDSPTCSNFGDSSRPHSCSQCVLIEFVPEECWGHHTPCRMIPMNDAGQTVEQLYGCSTQAELEEGVTLWLRTRIKELEAKAA